MPNIELAVGSWADCVHCRTQTSGLYRLVRSKAGRYALVCLSCYEAKESAHAKFWACVDKNGPVIRPELGPCWIWAGALLADGYGLYTHPSLRERRAHRAAWVLAHGEIDVSVHVLHRCDNPPCVRESHLFAGNHRTNMDDMHKKVRCNSILNWTSAREIRLAYKAGASRDELMAKYGIKYITLREVLIGKTWKESDAPTAS